jgi:hypothetical protein
VFKRVGVRSDDRPCAAGFWAAAGQCADTDDPAFAIEAGPSLRGAVSAIGVAGTWAQAVTAKHTAPSSRAVAP